MRYTAADDLAYVVADEFIPNDPNIYLMVVPDGTPAILNGSAALIFLAAISGEDPLTTVMKATGLSSEVLAAGVSTFIAELVSRRWIVPRPSPAP